jgi:hypothetical protein
MPIVKETDRFTLEEKIMNCWRVIDDLKTLGNVYDREHTEDEILNILIGITDLYDQRFNELFDTFEECIDRGVIK